jgi:hypothetical protein
LANATVCRAAYEVVTGRKVLLDQAPIVVNGDDGLVRAHPDYLPVWKSIAASAGLKPSVGKVYSHPTYMNINSTSYVFKDGQIVHVPYVNMGLVSGLSRSEGYVAPVQSDTEVDGFSLSLGARHKQLLSSCPDELLMKVHELFIAKNAEQLSKVALPWYVSESLGGVGLMPLLRVVGGDDIDDQRLTPRFTSTGHRCGPSDVDLACVSLLSSSSYSGRCPFKLATSQPILNRTIWSPRLREIHNLGRRMELSQADEGFLDTATFYLLPSLVMKQSPYDNTRLRNNERLWAYLSSRVVKQSRTALSAGME